MTATANSRDLRVGHDCPRCGIPIDAISFDESSTHDWISVRREVTLARFELPTQYCGVLESFTQFTDAYAKDVSQIDTPSIRWRLLIDRHPAAPYTNLQWIVNPWGHRPPGRLRIKLPPGATVELVAVRDSTGTDAITRVGGRITGRYWYDLSYGAFPEGTR